MRTTPVIRYVSLDEVRAEVARFEAAHPGIDADNFPDAFRDADGELIETEEFFEICARYSVLAAPGRVNPPLFPPRFVQCITDGKDHDGRTSHRGGRR